MLLTPLLLSGLSRTQSKEHTPQLFLTLSTWDSCGPSGVWGVCVDIGCSMAPVVDLNWRTTTESPGFWRKAKHSLASNYSPLERQSRLVTGTWWLDSCQWTPSSYNMDCPLWTGSYLIHQAVRPSILNNTPSKCPEGTNYKFRLLEFSVCLYLSHCRLFLDTYLWSHAEFLITSWPNADDSVMFWHQKEVEC